MAVKTKALHAMLKKRGCGKLRRRRILQRAGVESGKIGGLHFSLIRNARPRKPCRQDRTRKAIEWVLKQLQGGPVLHLEIYRRAELGGIDRGARGRAFKSLKCKLHWARLRMSVPPRPRPAAGRAEACGRGQCERAVFWMLPDQTPPTDVEARRILEEWRAANPARDKREAPATQPPPVLADNSKLPTARTNQAPPRPPAQPLPYIPTALQNRILNALQGKALTASNLEVKLSIDRKDLFRRGLNPLKTAGLIANSRRVGGYFRPDAPPPKFAKFFEHHPNPETEPPHRRH